MRDPQAPDLETKLLALRDVIDSAKSMPLSASVLVNRDEALDLVEDCLRALPDELRHARWLLKERDEVVTQGRRDADDLLEAARVQAARLVERTEIAREAQARVRRIIEDSESEARRLRHETEDYVDQKLASFEILLGKTLTAVQRGRETLRPALPVLESPSEDETQGEGFFDQDEM